jgi:hypothetical protein
VKTDNAPRKAVDVKVIDGAMPRGSRFAWRYPEVYELQPGQSLLYRWPRFEGIVNSNHSMRALCWYLRKTQGWDISHRKTKDGIWIERRS